MSELKNITVPDKQEIPEPAVEKAGLADMIPAIINGAGVGLLLGVLLGLAISPVVSGVIGTLSGLLAVLLGTSEKYMSRLKSVRIGAFGFFCVAGIMLGIHIRTNNAMMPDRGKMMLDYRKIGFSKQEALDFVAFREFGLVPAGWKGASVSGTDKNKTRNAKSDSSHANQQDAAKTVQNEQESSGRVFADAGATGSEFRSVLYSSEISSTGCYFVSMADSTQDVSEIRDKFERAGGTWKEMAHGLGNGLPEKIYIRALLAMRECFCLPGQTETIKIGMTARIKKINESQSLDDIKKTLLAAGGKWNTIVERIGAVIPVEYQKTLYISLVKIFKS